MWMLIKLAWRNIFRNKRRTLLSGLAIGVGLASLMFADGVIYSLGDTMVRSATESFSGNSQIHKIGFTKNLEVEKTITAEDKIKILNDLKNESAIKSFTPRVVGYGMLTSTFDANNIMIYGIDPQLEKTVSKLSENIIQGEFLDPKGTTITEDRKILIGKKLAENLNIGVGDKVVITVARAVAGDLSQEMFRIGGIFSFGSREMDEKVIFLDIQESQKIFNVGNDIHEIAVNFYDLKFPAQKDFPFAKKYSQNGNEMLGWNKMFKELDAMLHFTQFSLSILAIILFSIIALGIMNTIFMSLYERIFEFGVLRAVGTRPLYVGAMILFEALMLALLSTVIGIIIGTIVIYLFSKFGIDYRGVEYAHMVFKDKIYPHFRLIQFIVYPPCLILFSVLVGIYPAIYASRIIPAIALRKS